MVVPFYNRPRRVQIPPYSASLATVVDRVREHYSCRVEAVIKVHQVVRLVPLSYNRHFRNPAPEKSHPVPPTRLIAGQCHYSVIASVYFTSYFVYRMSRLRVRSVASVAMLPWILDWASARKSPETTPWRMWCKVLCQKWAIMPNHRGCWLGVVIFRALAERRLEACSMSMT